MAGLDGRACNLDAGETLLLAACCRSLVRARLTGEQRGDRDSGHRERIRRAESAGGGVQEVRGVGGEARRAVWLHESGFRSKLWLPAITLTRIILICIFGCQATRRGGAHPERIG